MNNPFSTIGTRITFGLVLMSLFIVDIVSAQTQKDGPKEFDGFSGFMQPAMRATRGDVPKLDETIPFSKGAIKTIDFKTQYQKIFLGADFAQVAFKEKGCQKLKNMLGSNDSKFVPIADGTFFKIISLTSINELDAYYKFENNGFLPGMLSDASVYVKMEAYSFGNARENNCLMLKFLIPEMVKDKVVENTYLMRNDGVLVLHPKLTEQDNKSKPDYSQFVLFPLKDMTETTHLVGKDFHVMGSFATQADCDQINGFLFPITRKGIASGCIFFRRIADVPEKFAQTNTQTGTTK